MKYQKSTKILSEAGEPTDPSRRRFLKTAGAAAAMPNQTLGLAKTLMTSPAKKSAIDAIGLLFQAVSSYGEESNFKTILSKQFKKSQGIDGQVPWGESYEIKTSPLGHKYLVTSSPNKGSVIVTYIKNGTPKTMELDWSDVIYADKHAAYIAYDWLDEGETDDLGPLIDQVVTAEEEDFGQSGVDDRFTKFSYPVKAASNINPIKAASNLAGLDQIKNLVKKLLRTDQTQTQSQPQPQTSAEKPVLPALPAPDKTQAEIMAQLRDIVDRDLTQPEKALVKREVEQETENLKKPPDESWG